jgi:hypothetical protein
MTLGKLRREKGGSIAANAWSTCLLIGEPPGACGRRPGRACDAKAIEKVALTQEWVLTRLMENAERALQHVAVLDKERKPTGEYRYDGNVANRALELLGKQQGMFIDRHEVGQPNEFANWTDEELRAFIKSGTEALGIVPGKTQH